MAQRSIIGLFTDEDAAADAMDAVAGGDGLSNRLNTALRGLERVRAALDGAEGGEGENRGYHHKCGGYKGRVQAGDAPFIAAQAFQALKGYVQ